MARKPTAARAQMGFTCLVCPGQPSIITGGDPGDPQAFDNARKGARSHLAEHAAQIAEAGRVSELYRVYPRVRSGPTQVEQAAA